MLPEFPLFSKIDITHKTKLESMVSAYEPYSDFDFTSLFCWNTDGSTEIASLNENLVIKLPDYISGETTYSLLGKNRIDDSLVELLKEFSEISLVPEIVVKHIINQDLFEISEDRDQFDYIYSIFDHATFTGKKFKSKRNKMNRFLQANEENINLEFADFQNKEHHAVIKQIFDKWAHEGDKNSDDAAQESLAIDRLLEFGSEFNLLGQILTINGNPEGFSVVEILSDEYAIYHFQKSLSGNPGIDIYLTNCTSKILLDRGCKYINWEQDLGLEGLRNAKINYQPIKLLKKYTIKLKA
jgi:hypothetical protein